MVSGDKIDEDMKYLQRLWRRYAYLKNRSDKQIEAYGNPLIHS